MPHQSQVIKLNFKSDQGKLLDSGRQNYGDLLMDIECFNDPESASMVFMF